MILGFTGTKHGMTHRQRDTVRFLFNELACHVLHHGDCVGADAQAHRLALNIEARVVIHPPSVETFRAYCVGADVIRPACAYLMRNRHIVNAAEDGLIAAPRTHAEELRGSGTWATIRYARAARKRLWIVWPDGTFVPENITGVQQ